ncbi:hypothetical protein, partial [Candidatus Pelagibacter sp. HIMB1542]|uniref:hypothetical protein n=1 Tax=Candidatus Pelagibacter sp. HIMB1542 TaxID=3413346 RepID=UPI003F8744BC
ILQSNNNINKIKKIKTINNLINKYKYINFYGNNDGMECYLFLKKKQNVNFHFLEHGHGNLLHFYLNKNNLKDIVKNFILKCLFHINLNLSYPVSFNSYNGSLATQNMKLRINGNTVKKIHKLTNLDKFVFKYFKKIKPPSEKLIWINFFDPSLKFKTKKFNEILNYLIKNYNKKKNILYIKKHPNKNYKIDIHSQKLIKFLKSKKIKFIIENKKRTLIPIEIIFLFYKIKESYSFLNTSTLINAKLIKNYKNYIFLDYSLNCSQVYKYSKNIKNFYLKNFRINTNFI